MLAISRIIVLFLLLHLSITLFAQTIKVPPPSPSNKDIATLNILDGINTMRSGGYGREADQMQKLLDDGNIYYRTTGKHKIDAQFIHPFITGSDTLYFGVQHVKFVKGKLERFDSSNYRYLYLLVQTSMHEMIHKDQSRTSIYTSVKRSAARGYALHEIEATRGAYKKYATKWVIADINAYLQKKDGLSDLQNKDAITLLRHKLFPLENSLAGITKGPHGDKLCRWASIGKEVVALDNYLIAMLLDAGSKHSCQGNLPTEGMNKQVAIESNLKCNVLNKKISVNDKALKTLKQQYRERKKLLRAAQRKLSRSKKQSDRLKLAGEISKLNNAVNTLRSQMNAARAERNKHRGQLKDIKNTHSRSMLNYTNALFRYDQCRKDYVNKRVKSKKLKADQLPPDMIFTAGGKLEIVDKKDERKMDLKKSIDALQDMFDYSIELTGVVSSLVGDDPRTPCYKGNKTGVPSTVANKKPKNGKKKKDKTKTGKATGNTDTWVQFKNNTVVLRYTESRVVTKTKTIVTKKKRCRGGGLAGRLECDVTARIAGEDRGTTTTKTIIVKDRRGRPIKKTYRAKITITLAPAVMRVSEGCMDTYQASIDVLSIKKQIPKELAGKNLAAEADAYAKNLKQWYKNLNIVHIRQIRRSKTFQANMSRTNAALKTLKGAPARIVFSR